MAAENLLYNFVMNFKTIKTTKAFTLIELIFIIVILGILAAVTIPKLAVTRADTEIEIYKQTWNNYKRENPYSAVVIESLIETGIIASTTIETLPIVGVRSVVLHLTKQVSKTEYPLYTTKKLKLFITKPAYEAYLMKDANIKYVAGKNVMQRNNTFTKNRKNIERMQRGKAPIGKDGLPIELHHLRQKNDLVVMELLAKQEHKKHSKLLHDSNKKTEINREEFNKFRQIYWKERAKDFQ